MSNNQLSIRRIDPGVSGAMELDSLRLQYGSQLGADLPAMLNTALAAIGLGCYDGMLPHGLPAELFRKQRQEGHDFEVYLRLDIPILDDEQIRLVIDKLRPELARQVLTHIVTQGAGMDLARVDPQAAPLSLSSFWLIFVFPAAAVKHGNHSTTITVDVPSRTVTHCFGDGDNLTGTVIDLAPERS
ncbi:hypothetical protein JNJ66_01875 [Candidatus Saccharibacteria bacterium]|nr:hypothetical protein [Candidatus Saccharibacteria bacterium]